ncbi:MAG TPA: 2-oxoglutarate and iron-dependent oxygenase domain-containing protein, partial [Acidimicrobiales bacterium]|nr:2-oxoglutarate and iron-dependent oxygenase domain-containing protein [Acidimicrobiales bacterium]
MADLVSIVDLDSGDAPERLDEACRTVGFVSVVGHGVGWPIVEEMLAATDEFFALPPDVKRHYLSPSPDINRGYAAKGAEGLSYSLGVDGRPPDLFEAFNMGPDAPPPALESRAEFAANIWPEEIASLRPALVAYFSEMAHLSRR